jgi:hypothetical protein
MKPKLLCGLLAAHFTLTFASAWAQDELPLVEPRVKTLAAFKNGLSFVFKAGETPLTDGWARMGQLPSAALGSLWIGTTSKSGPVTDVISYKQKVTENPEAITLAELLSANVGRRVAVTYELGTTPTRVEGTLLAVPHDRKPGEPAVSAIPAPPYAPTPSSPEKLEGEIVLIRGATSNQTAVLSVNKAVIQSVELLDGPNLKAAIEKEVPRTKIRVGGNPKSAEITMSYLEKGIVWSPSYRVNIADEKTAAISLDAVLADDVEDLDNVDVSFVVGYPNFLHADLITPLSLQQSVAEFVQSLMMDHRNDQYNRFGNVMQQSIGYNNAANFDASARSEALYSVAQPLPGEASEDLYFYKKSGVSLKKGDRARYEVFTASVPYEHIYQWEIPDEMNLDDNGYRQNQNNRNEPPEEQIWHVLRLENNTKQPWTTAPAFAMNGAMPVAQDVLHYVPPGAKSILKLTVATDLRPEASQTETGRKSVNLENYQYEEITVAGKLKVTSWKSVETCVVIRKSLTGDVLEAGNGKVTKVARRLASVNPASEIEWEFHLPPSKEKELTYQYKVLVRR